MRVAIMMLTTVLLTTSCETSAGFGTRSEQQVCDELRLVLPDWARADTELSKEKGARFLAVFARVCPDPE